MKRLVLIDGNAILHRAFHALPPFTTPAGVLVNAVYGFTSMLLKIVNDLKPTHMAVAFDRPAPTFRQEMYREYQAQRPAMDTSLVPQVDRVHQLLQAFGLAVFEKDGYEADDMIGTLAKEAVKSGLDQVIIVSSDRDLLQLVSSKVKAYMPLKGLSEAKLYGEAETKERLGVEPKQIPDYKALAGDPSDNYPGIAGIGPKTAANLLRQFDSLEKVLEAVKTSDDRLKKLPQGVRDKLAAGVSDAIMSHELATVKTDVPLEVDFDKLQVKTLDTPPARQELEALNFKSLLKRLSGKIETKTPAKTKKIEQKKTSAGQLKLV